MFSFLNSGILFLLLSFIIPILIYLFAKKKPQKIFFSSIKLIKESQQSQKKKIKIKNFLILLLRILIIIFTILAISRPMLKHKLLSKGKKHPKTAVAIIIDNSYSMDYLIDTQTELVKAKNIALTINDYLADEDMVVLLTLNQDWNLINSNLKYGKLNKKLIGNIQISAQSEELEKVHKEAINLLKESQFTNQEIYIISDLQQQAILNESSVPTFFIPTSDLQVKKNISLQEAALQPNYISKDFNEKISFKATNHFNSKQEDIICQLTLNGHTKAEKVINLNPFQNKTFSFPISLEKKGWHSGYVKVRDERLAYDNKNYFSFFYNPNPKVAFISDNKKIPVVLQSLLNIYTDKESINFLTNNININHLQTSQNVIIYDKNYSTRLEKIINDFIEMGNKILFIADNNLNKNWQTFLEQRMQNNFLKFYQNENNLLIAGKNDYHPITKALKDINDTQINDFWLTSGNQNIMLSTDKYPISLENKGILLWLFDIGSPYNPLFLDTNFPVFAYNSLKFTANLTQNKNILHIGNKIMLNNNEIFLPSGEKIKLKKNIYFPQKTGIYKTEINQFAVNLNYNESEYKQLKKQNKHNITFLDLNSWENNILQSRYGFDLWKYLLLIVLILIALEMYLVKREEKKQIN